MSLSGRGVAIVRDGLNPNTHDGQHLRVDEEIESFPYVKNLSPIANCVSLPIIHERLAILPAMPSEELTYDCMAGSRRTRELIARFLSNKLLNDSVFPEQIVALDGQTSILNAIAFCLCEEGDRVLAPSECIDELAYMFAYRAKVETVAVSYPVQPNSVHDVVQRLETTWQDSGAESSRIRIVYMASPDVYGTRLDVKRYSETALLNSIVTWASSRGLHTVVDVTNALNVAIDHNAPKSWKMEAPRDDIHIIWNASRFFNIPGASLCALTTRNKAMLKVMGAKLCYFGSTSRQTQWIIQHMLSDANFVDSFVEENQKQVKTAHQICVEKLETMRIPYLFASAGCLILLGLGDLAKDSTYFKRLISHSAIRFSSCSDHLFLYYAGVTPDELDTVLRDLGACMLSSD